MTMKSLLLLSVLLLSAGTSKAKDGRSPKEAFIFGTITGVGGLLCSMEEAGEFDKDAARQYFNAWVSESKKRPEASDAIPTIDYAYMIITSDVECKALFIQ